MPRSRCAPGCWRSSRATTRARWICWRARSTPSPTSWIAHTCLGGSLKALGRLDEAIATHRRAVELGGDYRALSNLALTYRAAGRPDEAIVTLEAAIARAPGEAELHGNLSGLLLAAGRAVEAEAAARRALAIAPGEARFATNLAYARKEQGDFAGALVHLRRAIALDPQDADAHWNLGLTLLAAPATPADEAEGWRALEWRHRIPGLGVTPTAALASTPVWAGEPLAGRTLLLQAEQGLGDTLQLARYARAAKAIAGAGAIVLECQPPLERVLRRCAGVDARGRARRRATARRCARRPVQRARLPGRRGARGHAARAVSHRRAGADRALAGVARRAHRGRALSHRHRLARQPALSRRRAAVDPARVLRAVAAVDRGRGWRRGEPAEGRRPPAAGGAAVRDLGGRRRGRRWTPTALSSTRRR